MFSGILELQRMAKDAYSRMNSVRTAYRELESVDKQNPLLTLLIINEDKEKRSEHPDICSVYFTWRFTPEFVERYKKFQPALTSNVMLDFAEGLERYVLDIEEELKRVKK